MNTAATTPLSPGTHTVNVGRVAQRYQSAPVTGPEHFAESARNMEAFAPLSSVICGPRRAGELAAGIPRAELVLLEHSGHLGHVEEPEAFARAVTAFVAATAG
ncbi:alpha/beta fold hydrolase [Nonomuraea sp. MTCD27]|uniref:alpha/beta fold hydrolase n=1 Tax=Nonomuraea sp. MTCD27 TaxID=1676747 RepID=UPI0035C07AD2